MSAINEAEHYDGILKTREALAMTTDAPPEKMSDADWLEQLAQQFDGISGTGPLIARHGPTVIAARLRDIAARRLSAPAGDGEVLTAVHCGTGTGKSQLMRASGAIAGVIFDDHKLAVAICNALSAPTLAAPWVEDGPPREPTEAMQKVGYELVCELVETGSLASPADIWRAMYDIALSAPPAASADERGQLLQAIAPNGRLETTSLAELADNILAAGFSKLAPAQSVGQSAAQGVALPKVWGVSRMADNDQAILVSFRRPPTDDELRALHDHLRRLSALPKGQEHE